MRSIAENAEHWRHIGINSANKKDVSCALRIPAIRCIVNLCDSTSSLLFFSRSFNHGIH